MLGGVPVAPIAIHELFYREAGTDYHIAEHAQPLLQWYVCVHGAVLTRLAGREIELGPGQSVLYRPGVLREPRCRGRAPGYLIAIFADHGLKLSAICDRRLALPLALRGDLLALIDELRGKRSDESRHLCQALLVRLLIGQRRAALAGREAPPPQNARAVADMLGRAEEFMRAELHRPLERAEIAAAAGCSVPHLTRLFRLAGSTVVDRLTDLRLERARRLLRETGGGVAQVAAAVGFASASHFAAVFKRAAGVSPSDYRRGGGRYWKS